jgi:preprotein translocase subunit SecA
VVLARIDHNWQDHLLAVDDLREHVGLRGYAQLDPLHEYQREASLLFEDMMFNIHREVFEHFFLVQPAYQQPEPEQRVQRMEARQARLDEVIPMAPPPEESEEMEAMAAEMEAGGGNGPRGGRPQRPAPHTPVRTGPKVGRNEPCPCGSGKKYKKCCGSVGGAE